MKVGKKKRWKGWINDRLKKIFSYQKHLSKDDVHAHLFERDHSDQTSHAGHVGVIQTQQREDRVGL